MLPYLQHLLDNRGFREFLIEKESLGKRKKACNETKNFMAPPSKDFLITLKIERVVHEFGIVPDSDKAKFKLK